MAVPSVDGAVLEGVRIGVTADRRWEEQADLLRRRGAEVVHGPTLCTVDLSAEEPLRRATEQLAERPPQVTVVTTGMGFRLWLESAVGWDLGPRLEAALAGSAMIARGAKAASAVRRAGFDVAWRAPAETMDDVVAHVAGAHRGCGRIALQLFDPGSHPSTAALRALTHELVEVPVYRWRLPEDLGPARRLIEAAVAGELDAVTFTSQPAVRHLLQIAAASDHDGALRRRFDDGLIASCVGPVCAEAAREVGIERPVWPEPPRLVAMVRQLSGLLEARRP